MSVSTLALRDSATMLRRDLRHAMRYPMLAIGGLLVPVFLLLLFVGVFGNTLHAGLGAAAPAGGHYIDYLDSRDPRDHRRCKRSRHGDQRVHRHE